MTVQPATDRTEYEDPRITRSRALIMEAAARVFLQRGYPGTSVDDIAAEAGVSKRTVYNVFEDKEQLFRAIIGQAIETAERYAQEFAATAGTSHLESLFGYWSVVPEGRRASLVANASHDFTDQFST